MDTGAYLARLGLAGPPETLAELQVAHLLAVPFENLDIGAGIPISIEPDAIFDKVVRRRRGGFCYELNGLFAWLLEDLGYSVTMLSARVVDDVDEGQEFDHLVLRVDLDEPWLVDVGFGDTFREPIPLRPDSERVDSLGRTYRLRVSGDDWELSDQERTQYRFTLEPRAFAEFEPMCRWQQTESEHFTGHRICTIATGEGRRTLLDDRLIVHAGADRTEREVDEGEVPELLSSLFGIADPDLVSERS